MRSILITGGLGFIGTHTCYSLLCKQYTIYVIDSLTNSSISSLTNVLNLYRKDFPMSANTINFTKGDIRDLETLERLFITAKNDGNPIEGVIHFAGLKAVAESIIHPSVYWDINVKGTINLLKAMDKYGCKTIVYSSSATVYGASNKSPISEQGSLGPINPYGHTKYASELLLKDIFNATRSDWRIAILRYFNPIGAHPSGEIGESPQGIPNNVFPYICKVANKRLDKLNIFGNDWPTIDGTCIRDYIHVLDLADGHLAALNFLFSDSPQLITVNLGTGNGVSVLELVKTFQKVNQISFDYQFTERRPGDCAVMFADINYAKSCLDWSPKRSLEDMCRDGWKWETKNPTGYY